MGVGIYQARHDDPALGINRFRGFKGSDFNQGLFPFIGREFLPYLDEGTIVIQTEKLPSISLERSMAGDTDIQKALMTLPEVTGMVSRRPPILRMSPGSNTSSPSS